MNCLTPDGLAVATSPTEVDVGFQGQIRDEVNGLYQMGYRSLSATSGQWLSMDPIGLHGGINLVTFANNQPNDLSDPRGLTPKCPSGYYPIKFNYIQYKGSWGFGSCHVSIEHGGYCPMKTEEETYELTIREFRQKCRPCDDGNLKRPLVEVSNQEAHYFCVPLGANGIIVSINPCKVDIGKLYERAKD